jgi:outer membrane protein
MVVDTMKIFLLFGLMLLIVSMGFSQQEILDNYVQQGIKNNLALKQQTLTFEQSQQALNQARGLFLPSVSLEARYSRAGGGRVIEIPIGDLMNPVYGTLNDLLSAIGQQPVFPTNLLNEHIPFLREREHETKIRIIQPIFQPAIFYNYKIKSSLTNVQKAATSMFKRQLTADIKTAYYNYLKTRQVVELLRKTHKLLHENLRVSESLFKNGKATEEIVFRAKAEISEFDQKMFDALKNKKLAAGYFNFLINHPLESEINIIAETRLTFYHEINLEDARIQAIQNREEFQQLHSAVAVTENRMRINKSTFLPGLTGIADYGYQGEKYRFTEKDDYWMASLVLHWNLFNGFQDRSKYKQSSLEKQKFEIQLEELKNKIKLQVQEAVDNLSVAQKSIVAANQRFNSMKKSYKIVSKKYQQGITSQLEYIDARTAFTNSGINQVIVKYDYQIKFVEFENVVGNR